MSPDRAQAAARIDDDAVGRRASRPVALRSADPPSTRFSGLATALRSGNLLGRVGTLTAIALFVAVFGVVVFQALLVQGQARLDHLNGQIATQQQESKQLRLQLAQLDSPERIVTAARGLGMIDPGDVVYIQPSATDDAKATLPPPPATTPAHATTSTTVKAPRP